MRKSVLAIAAHPDDIEFVMAGTLLRLVELGWEAHYFNVANGCCGSTKLGRVECAAVRLQEAMLAAGKLPAKFYAPICDDLELFYNRENHQKVAAVVREAKPSIVLTHALSDYMEDHQNAARLAVSGTFVRSMPNFETAPSIPHFEGDVAIYHAQPHGNRDPLGNKVTPRLFVDVTKFAKQKRELLECHASQNAWLDESQGMSSYVATMEKLNSEVGQMSTTGFDLAEGWTPHLHLGFAASGDFDPLSDALKLS